MKIDASKKIAKSLLDIGAVKFNTNNPFTWASGIKSPIYCDNRIINSRVAIRDIVIGEFSNIISANFLSQIDHISGVATGGISYGGIIADRLKMPFIYVRSERKSHGLMKMVEGEYKTGEKTVLIEDHISTGLSSMRAIEGLREEGIEPVCLLSITTYGFRQAEDLFKRKNVQYQSICDLDTILDVAREEGILTSEDVTTILNFKEAPKDWFAARSL
jgi:orotate phosphoribosyltransferase